jgi:hypothetical protein
MLTKSLELAIIVPLCSKILTHMQGIVRNSKSHLEEKIKLHSPWNL